MRDLFLLIRPRITGLRNRLSHETGAFRKKAMILVLVGLGFWGLLFLMSSRMLLYFRSVEVIGDILAHHLLAMVLLTFFFLLIFSHIINALSNLYLSSDLELVHSSPADPDEIFLSRAVNTLFDSSWMVILFGFPVLMSYAYVFRPGVGYYISLLHALMAIVIIAGGLGILFTMIMVSIFPARKTRDIIMLLMIFGIIAIYLLFRLLRPERLVNPDAFFSVMQYVTALESPDSVYLPTHWATQILWAFLNNGNKKDMLFDILLLWSSAGSLLTINVWAARSLYFTGFSKSQEAKRRRAGRGLLDGVIRIVTHPMEPETASVAEKDIRNFFRDNTQWSQLFLLGALVVVYLYNFSVLPLERSPIRLEFLQNEIAFLNLGLAGFVLAAISVRFIFPSVSSEGKAFWIIQSSPVPLKRFLWGKFFLYIIPMVILGELLIIITNQILKVTTFMMLLSSITMFFAVLGIVAIGIGFGAIYPNFRYENLSQVSTGFGGLMYMMICALFMGIIIILEAGPVYILFMADVQDRGVTFFQWMYIVPAFLLVLLITVFAVYQPMKMGLAALSRYE